MDVEIATTTTATDSAPVATKRAREDAPGSNTEDKTGVASEDTAQARKKHKVSPDDSVDADNDPTAIKPTNGLYYLHILNARAAAKLHSSFIITWHLGDEADPADLKFERRANSRTWVCGPINTGVYLVAEAVRRALKQHGIDADTCAELSQSCGMFHDGRPVFGSELTVASSSL